MPLILPGSNITYINMDVNQIITIVNITSIGGPDVGGNGNNYVNFTSGHAGRARIKGYGNISIEDLLRVVKPRGVKCGVPNLKVCPALTA